MPARKRRPARSPSAPRGAAAPRRKKKGTGAPPWMAVLLLLSLGCLAVAVTMLVREKQNDPEQAELDRKVQELARKHPDADIFQIHEDPVKKKP
ncbi:MAG: hypothetical protein ACFCUX_06610 [Candidatus Methylacidiphilales bacterium]